MAEGTAYSLGIDIGTSYTAAATYQQMGAVLDLETRTASMASVVYRRDDGTLLVGEAALRRGSNDAGSLAVEFKRRFGDDTPLVLAGHPVTVDEATAAVMRRVLDVAQERNGREPDAVALTYPTAWGEHRLNRLRSVAESIGLAEVLLVSEPVAAAIHYAFDGRVDIGEAVAVYDLGGGTFDATILRRTSDGFETVGEPKGLERMGGADFDHAVLRHAVAQLDEGARDLDRSDPPVAAAFERLRRESIEVKEALSSDTEATIPVGIPGFERDVRLTRAELEAMVRPDVEATLDTMGLAIAASGLDSADISKILMVGDSSRMPLIRDMVAQRFDRPVLADVHPKHACSLGAAALAMRDQSAAVPTGGSGLLRTERQVAAAPVVSDHAAGVVDGGPDGAVENGGARLGSSPDRAVRPVVVAIALALALAGIAVGLALGLGG